MIQGIVDRFEWNIAVAEIDGKEMKDFPKKALFKGVKVGDKLLIDGTTSQLLKKARKN